MRLLFAAIAMLALSSIGALAEPWRTDSLQLESGTVYSASQISTSGDYALVVECAPDAPFGVWVESPFDWEPDASYAPEVPTTFVISGTPIPEMMFLFDDRQLGEGVTANTRDQGALTMVLDAMLATADDGEIKLTYFDRSASFPTEGLVDSLNTLLGNCL